MPSRLIVPFSSHPVLPNCRTAFRPSCGRAVLFSSSHRSPHALPSSSPHDRITRAWQRIPPTPSERASNKRTSRTPIGMIWDPPPTQERLITYPQGNKTNEKETRRASKTTRQDDMTRRKDRDTGIGRDATRDTQNEKNGTSKQDETGKRDARRDEGTRRIRTIRASNKRGPDRKNETPHGTHKRDERRDDTGERAHRQSIKKIKHTREKNIKSPYLSPDPLPPALPYLRASYSPPPPGGWTSGRRKHRPTPAPFQPAHSSHEWAIGQRHTKHDTGTGRDNEPRKQDERTSRRTGRQRDG